MIKKLHKFILVILAPISKLIAKIKLEHPQDYGADCDALYLCLKEESGIILSRTNNVSTNPFIPGFWKHAAFLHQGIVIEAVTKGVQLVTLRKWLTTKDYVALACPKNISFEQFFAAYNKAFECAGAPYDWNFEPNNKAFYCAELITECFAAVGVDPKDWSHREFLGVKTTVPQDFFDAKEKMIIKYDTRKECC